MRLAFFLGEEMLGIGFITEPVSTHYFCPRCGAIWGREVVLDGESTHGTLCVNCPEHPDPHWTPPVISHHDFEPRYWVRKVPREVLRRDFLYLCELLCQEQL